ncbi:DUF559 domain-containing protein [Mesorhizobium sp. VK24D]|uniref:DUF559 domain-containing protein n=1 Tax=Mesorhizobium album TaxID=3072314 RepID=A0ABU4Y8U2_9HYPH|nr:DUF559 domain-containing protein [Mesorhizobium sp. VK24D]MDX8483346.1 DUF559 domain-containing protein [Mesorhizobium sp. VK24D]
MPHQPVKQTKRRFARSLRREMTEAEDKLWQELRDRRLDRIKFSASGSYWKIHRRFRLPRSSPDRRDRWQPACGFGV